MEISVSRAEKTHRVEWNSTPPQDSRSYRCSFCKRGFSNAQALGGHMNIHRKDRAKLKKFYVEDSLSEDDQEIFRDQLQLSLSLKSSSSARNYQKKESHSRLGKTIMMPSGFDATAEMDLELRLGLEPHD